FAPAAAPTAPGFSFSRCMSGHLAVTSRIREHPVKGDLWHAKQAPDADDRNIPASSRFVAGVPPQAELCAGLGHSHHNAFVSRGHLSCPFWLTECRQVKFSPCA